MAPSVGQRSQERSLDTITVDLTAVTRFVEAHGFRVRGSVAVDDLSAGDVELLPEVNGRPATAIIVIGNVGGEMWPHFRRADPTGTPNDDALDRWTRACLQPIADSIGAVYLHPSDQPYWPVQRWAAVADVVELSPIGLLVHPEYGLWHAYRGVFVIADPVTGAGTNSAQPASMSPCLTCAEQPCLSTCPVDAIGRGRYDVDACRGHVASGNEPACATEGCAARVACPVGVEFRYGGDQMAFHMRAFTGG